jgi:hypothetical protein
MEVEVLEVDDTDAPVHVEVIHFMHRTETT